jgi:serine/threonine-protein kinase
MAKKRASPAPLSCPSCGHVAEPSAGELNFCPACGAGLRRATRRRSAAGGADAGNEALLGQVIADRYRLIALVGEGGMGAVYKAEHVRMGKALALKLLRGDFAREPGAVERFRAEAQIVSRLSHPHTIGVFDFGEIGGGDGFYLAMEYVPGRDLAAVLREARRLPEGRAVGIGQQILGSLAEAHDAGVVHRDMKPANVMLLETRGGEDFVKVLDFGIAKLRDDTGATTTAADAGAGVIVGTPSYLAPEQARGEGVDARSDLYAVGCLLYELVAGHPPFVAPSPMAVVAAHLNQAPAPLGDVAPGVTRRFAEVVHRALEKRAGARFPSADAMRTALLAAGEQGGPRRPTRPPPAAITGDLEIASRDDFRALDRTPLRRGPRIAPLVAVLLLAAGGAAAWRWQSLYARVAARWPEVAQAVPAELRPSDRYDGVEREPNEVPARANPLPIPAGPDGRAAGGVAVVRGYVGAKLDEARGDVDLYRIELPAALPGGVLTATWRGEGDDGIRGLDVTLALNRARAGDDSGPAPLVTAVNRGGPGAPERLAAAVEPGTYYLAVREQHDPASGPVEKPSDRYVLTVRLGERAPGEELEPNDGPDRAARGPERYPAWRAVAERNPLAEGAPLRADGAPDDPDVFAVPGGPEAPPRAVLVVPAAGLALEARLWTPDREDLGPSAADRVRFVPVAQGAPGDVLLVPLAPPAPDAPALLQVRGLDGAGRYTALVVGESPASGEAALGLFRALAAEQRTAAALELAAAHAAAAPLAAAARTALLLLAGELAEATAPALSADALPAFEHATVLLGAPVLARDGERVTYGGAFEARVAGAGPDADVAALRRVRLETPCAPAEVAERAARFLARVPPPAPALTLTARTWRARALEEAFWAGGGADAAARTAAIEAWRAVESSEGVPALGALEASARAAALAAPVPSRDGAGPLCPLPPE